MTAFLCQFGIEFHLSCYQFRRRSNIAVSYTACLRVTSKFFFSLTSIQFTTCQVSGLMK